MVQLKGPYAAARLAEAVQFQFLHGTIKSAILRQHCVLGRSFNSYMVQLKDANAGDKDKYVQRFNSYMVQLKA